jgi:hypothetical protein
VGRFSPSYDHLTCQACHINMGSRGDGGHARVHQSPLRRFSKQRQSRTLSVRFAPNQGNRGCKTANDAYNPSIVTNIVMMVTKRPPVCSGRENHTENWESTRPVSIPCTKRPITPGTSTLPLLCVLPFIPIKVACEWDMTLVSRDPPLVVHARGKNRWKRKTSD